MKALPSPDIPPYAWDEKHQYGVKKCECTWMPSYITTFQSSPVRIWKLIVQRESFHLPEMFIPSQSFPNQHHWYLEDSEASLEEVIKGSSRCLRTKFATKQLRMRIWRWRERQEEKEKKPACQAEQRWRWIGRGERAEQQWKQLSQPEIWPNLPWLSSTWEETSSFG